MHKKRSKPVKKSIKKPVERPVLQSLEKPVKKELLSDQDRIGKYESQWSDCDSALASIRKEWRDNESVFFNDNPGAIADSTKSKVNDGHLSTSIIQRTQRIMAQPPIGKVDYLDKKDRGKNMILNLILQKYIIPNSNAQYRHLMKLKMVSIYSQIYGKQPVLRYYSVTDDYVGPDFQLIPINQYYPQPGVFQDSDQDYCFVDTKMTVGQIKQLPKSTWKNIDELLTLVKETKGKIRYPNPTFNESKYGIDFEGVLFRTRYDRNRWITYAPDYSSVGILREVITDKDKKIPVIVKQTIPLLDRCSGWSDTERGKALQLTQNSLASLTLDSIKYKLFPITIVNPTQVIKQSLVRQAGAIWEEKAPNSIRSYNESIQDIGVFNNMSGYIISSLNNLLGSSDISVSRNVDLTMGKTPTALKMQAMRESAADSWERQSIEDFCEELYDSFIDMIAQNQPKPIDINLFSGEIESIAKVYPDINEMYDKVSGKLTIKPDSIKGKYKFFIDSGSTVQKDNIQENQALMVILQTLMKLPNFRQELQSKGKDIDLAELIKRFIITTGIADSDKIIVDFTPEASPNALGRTIPNEVVGNIHQGQIPQPPVQNSQNLLSNITDPQILEAAQKIMGGRQ